MTMKQGVRKRKELYKESKESDKITEKCNNIIHKHWTNRKQVILHIVGYENKLIYDIIQNR